MSAFKIVRDAENRVRACGPNSEQFDPVVPAGSRIEESDVFLPIDPTPEEDVAKQRRELDAAELFAAKLDSAVQQLVDAMPAGRMQWARNNFPTLTPTEQNMLGVILNILAVAVRPVVR